MKLIRTSTCAGVAFGIAAAADVGAFPGVAEASSGTATLSAGTLAVRKEVLAIAASIGEDPVTPAHLLLGMLEEDGGLGVVILDRLGVDLEQLHAALSEPPA